MATITFDYDARSAVMKHMIAAFMAAGAKITTPIKTASHSYENLNNESKASINDAANYKKRKRYSSVSSMMDALNS